MFIFKRLLVLTWPLFLFFLVLLWTSGTFGASTDPLASSPTLDGGKTSRCRGAWPTLASSSHLRISPPEFLRTCNTEEVAPCLQAVDRTTVDLTTAGRPTAGRTPGWVLLAMVLPQALLTVLPQALRTVLRTVLPQGHLTVLPQALRTVLPQALRTVLPQALRTVLRTVLPQALHTAHHRSKGTGAIHRLEVGTLLGRRSSVDALSES
jgi:hypothetical protein